MPLTRKTVTEKPSATMPGVVEKVIKSPWDEAEKAQITIETADHLYR
jgi:hypothetical protein